MSERALTNPVLVHRNEQAYVGFEARVTMADLGGVAHRIPELMEWLSARHVAPAGAPFFKYNVIDMGAELEVEVGVPVATAVAGRGEVHSRALPPGRYATVTHVGPPATLVGATQELLEWAAEQGLKWDMVAEGSKEWWGCRFESYLTDPRSEPDMRKWHTELAFRLAD